MGGRIMSAKKKPAERKPRPVMVPAPEYVTTCSVPYESVIVDLPINEYASTTELATEKKIRYRETYTGPLDLFCTIAHEALESAKRENMIKMEDHEELDRAAHVIAEHFFAWVMAQ